MHQFNLPPKIKMLVEARDQIKQHYQDIIVEKGGTAELRFTFDGNLMGDIGEALAVELFGIRLEETKSREGIDGYAPDKRSVQIKATGTGRGPAFRNTNVHADHLIFLI